MPNWQGTLAYFLFNAPRFSEERKYGFNSWPRSNLEAKVSAYLQLLWIQALSFRVWKCRFCQTFFFPFRIIQFKPRYSLLRCIHVCTPFYKFWEYLRMLFWCLHVWTCNLTFRIRMTKVCTCFISEAIQNSWRTTLLDHWDLPLRLHKDPQFCSNRHYGKWRILHLLVFDPPSTIFITTPFQTKKLHFFFVTVVLQAVKIFQYCFHIWSS